MREPPVRGPAVDLSEFERRMRGPEPKPAAKADPLSELARLMGEREDADPFGHILPDPRAQQPQRAAAPHAAREWEEDLRGSFDAAPQPSPEPRRYADDARHEPEFDPRAYPSQSFDQPGGSHQEQDYAEEPGYAGQQYDPAYHGDDGGWQDDSQYLDYGAEEAPEAEPRGGLRDRLRPWHAIAAVSVVAVASIAWGFMHRNGVGGSKEIAVIDAPPGPVKVKPSADAEQDQPNASGAAVLDRKDSTPVKQVVAHQEQAIDPTVAPKAVKLGAGPVDAPHEPALGAQPKRVKTVTVRPDGSRVDDAAALPPAVAKATSSPPAEPAQTRGATPKPEAKPVTTSQAAKPKAPPKTAAAEPAPAPGGDAAAPATPTTSGAYAVQFGAAGSEDEARALIKTVAAKYGVKPTFKPAKVGDKTVYRVRVAGVSKDSATAICNKVKSAGGSCFVAGN